MLRVENLTVYYEEALALNEVSLEVNAGELVALLGPNGAGKTTLVSALSGLLRERATRSRVVGEEIAIAGVIEFSGRRIENLSASQRVRLGIVHCPERRRPLPEMTVTENLEMGAYLQRNSREVREGIEKIFELFPALAGRRSQMAGLLSGGEQQMLAIGRALMAKPKLLLLDEPLLGLAPMLQKKIIESIKEVKERGIGVLLAEQNVVGALSIADRGYVLGNGIIVFSGAKQELVDNVQVREAYLGAG